MLILLLGYVGSLVSSFLPETLGAPIPQTPEDAEDFLTDQPYFSYRGKKFWKSRIIRIRVGTEKATEMSSGQVNEAYT